MDRYPELVIPHVDGGARRGVVIGTRHISVGRGPDNDLVLLDPQISRHHALIWCVGDRVFVRDLGSANGTFIAGERVVDTAEVPYGAPLVLGKTLELRVDPPRAPELVGRPAAVAVEDVQTGIRRPLHGEQFRIGSGPQADLRLDGCAPVAATLYAYPEGVVWLSRGDEDDVLLQEGDAFEVGGSPFRIVTADATRLPTAQSETDALSYRLRVELDGPAGPMAVVSQRHGHASHTITAENRVVLLYLLGRKAEDDRQSGLAPAVQGWCADEDIIVGVWGRSALPSGSNRLKVLVHRVRKELAEQGFESWCIEKRAGMIRGRFAQVELG
ncbi:FHA domain-containing protein [Myxococcota bacterium]|nr:FHA domain-containing protein [Myxococcota bacterium]